MPIKILYVEDDFICRRLVKRIVTRLGYDYVEAINGKSGVDLAQREKPDLIFMDINLPDIDGLEATRRIKNLEGFSNIPVIAMTSSALEGGSAYLQANKLDGYIGKPVNKIIVKNTIERMLSSPTAS